MVEGISPRGENRSDKHPIQEGHLGVHKVTVEYKRLFSEGLYFNRKEKEIFSVGKTAPDGIETKKVDDFGRLFFFGQKRS